MTLAIDCQNLVKTYPGKPPVEAVRGINFDVKVGECFGVLGPNGAGKTTTIEILEGLLSVSSGQAEVLGMNWSKNASSGRRERPAGNNVTTLRLKPVLQTPSIGYATILLPW